MDKKRIYAWIAPGGAGKGTQCDLLEQRRGVRHTVMSKLLTKRAEVDDTIGRHIKSTVGTKDLVKNEVTIQVLKDQLYDLDVMEFCLDGFPRTLDQAHALQSLTSYFDVFVYIIEVSDDTCKAQAAKRRAEAIKENENLVDAGLKPKPLRTDDDPEVVPERLKIYRQHEAAIVSYAYRAFPGRVFLIPGEASIEVVHQRIVATAPFAVLVG